MLRERGKRCTGGGNGNEERRRRVEGKKGKDGERRGGSKKHVGERREIRDDYAINIDGSPARSS